MIAIPPPLPAVFFLFFFFLEGGDKGVDDSPNSRRAIRRSGDETCGVTSGPCSSLLYPLFLFFFPLSLTDTLNRIICQITDKSLSDSVRINML